MQFSCVVLASLLASLAYSQTIADDVAMIPSCATSCLLSAAQSQNCAITDYACQCGSARSAITANATPCVLKACSTSDALKVQTLTNDICTLQASSSGSGSSSAASSSSSVSASSSLSSASSASSLSSIASSSTASSSSIASSIASTSSGALSSATSAAASKTSGAASSVSSAATSTTSTGASSQNKVGALVVVAAGVVAFAL